MPVMDGLTATKAIRQMERGETPCSYDSQELEGFSTFRGRYSQHTPIIGVTASVSEEDRAICLSAGMDGFLQKPIRRDLLLSLLYEWTTSKTAS